MIKNLIKIAATVATVFSLAAAPALADAPTLNVTIDSIAGQSVNPPSTITVNVPMLPWTVQVAGTGSVSQGALDGVDLTLTDNTTTFFGPDHAWQGIGGGTTHGFSEPWQISTAGNHTITATVTRGPATDTDTAEVIVNTLNIQVNQCKAAPAIAADYMLNYTNIKSGSTKWKTIINDLAHKSGISGGAFWAAHSCDSGYSMMVLGYLHTTYGI